MQKLRISCPVSTKVSIPWENGEYLVKLSSNKVCSRSCLFCMLRLNLAGCLILSKVISWRAREDGFSSRVLWMVVVLGRFCLQFMGVACNLCNAAFVCLSCKLMSGEWHVAKALDQQVSDIFVAMSFYSKQVSWRSFIPGFLSSLAFVSFC